MRTKDYAKEIGHHHEQRTVPMPFAIALIAVILVGGSAALYAARPAAPSHEGSKSFATAPAMAPAGK